jgi:catechol 2,3-dioxygenase-like lactoylglutathione lyase family enzyme
MELGRLSHVGICVSDLERALAFWRDALGFRESKRLDVFGDGAETLLGIPDLDLRVAVLEREELHIQLLHYASPGHRGTGEPRPMNALGITHLSLVVDDLEAAIAAVMASGGRVLRSTRLRIDDAGRAAIFVTDPDGTRIELVEGEVSA